MGYELRRWLADRLPSDLSSGERLVALEIADQANDKTRRAYGREVLGVIVRRAGYANDKQLGKVLGKLAARGIELRVPVRDGEGRVVLDKRGRTLFACNGHALAFYVPTTEECPALKAPQEGDLEPDPGDLGSSPHRGTYMSEAPPPGPEAPPPGDGSSPAWSPKVPPSGEPSPQSPQDSSSLLSQSAQDREGVRHLRATFRLTDQEAAEVIQEVRRRAAAPIVSLVPYLVGMAEGDLADIVAAAMDASEARPRGAAVPAPPGTPIPPLYTEFVARPPCPHGMPGGDQARSEAGTPPCPQCRRALAASVAVLPPGGRPRPSTDVHGARPDLSALRAELLAARAAWNPRPRPRPYGPQ